jgi:RHS repeat-associated protein
MTLESVVTFRLLRMGYRAVPFYYVSMASTALYFAGRLLSAQDRLGSVGTYYPYGEEYTPTGQDGDKYATYFGDAATNLQYAKNRYYSSAMRRFLTPDPYRASGGPADPGSWNRYANVVADPVNHVDPTGLRWNDPDQQISPFGPDSSGVICVVNGIGVPCITAGLDLIFSFQAGGMANACPIAGPLAVPCSVIRGVIGVAVGAAAMYELLSGLVCKSGYQTVG